MTATANLKDFPAAFKLVKGFNLYMKSLGSSGSFELDTLKVLKYAFLF